MVKSFPRWVILALCLVVAATLSILTLLGDSGAGLFMLDAELAQRVLAPPTQP